MSAALSIHIDAPVKKVFDFYKDPRNQWSTMPRQVLDYGKVTDVKVTKEGVGTYDSWTMDFAGLRMEGFDVVTEYVPNERITSRSSRPSIGTVTCTFEPEGSGTRFTIQRHAGSFWAWRPLDQLFERIFAPSWQKSLENLKAQMEAGTATGEAPAASATGAR